MRGASDYVLVSSQVVTRFTGSLGILVLLAAGTSACGGQKDDAGKKADSGEKVDKPDKPDEDTPDKPDKPADVDACAFPTTATGSPEQLAWQIFVAAMCKSPDGSAYPLVFENWTEQTCISNPSAPECGKDSDARQLHGSVLKTAGLPSGDCNAMATKTTKGLDPSLLPFIPTNLAKGAKFCEEVFANQAEIAYIREKSLTTLAGQAAALPIQFPTEAIEIKVDWLPVDALSTPEFSCDEPSDEIYTETINGDCYAMVGLHISSKLYPNWLWATFEPQFAATNPNRCNPDLYNSCSDPWGSDPATSTGEPTNRTPALEQLMRAAKLPKAFENYRLVGVQTDYVDAQTTLLGNSFVELNAEVPAQQASCITCHSYAQFDDSQTPPVENPNFGAFPKTPPTGTPVTQQPPVPPGSWQSQDFSWMLGIMPAK